LRSILFEAYRGYNLIIRKTIKRDLIPGLVSLAGIAIIIGLRALLLYSEVVPYTYMEPINLKVRPTQVAPGETVIITMEVRSVGTERKAFLLELVIDGVVEQTKWTTLDAGETKSRVFFVKKDIEGSYSVQLDGLTETFVVVKPEPSP